MLEVDEEIRQAVQADIPKFLYLHCISCLRYVRIEELNAEIAKSGPLKGNKTVFGNCRRCGEEVRESIHTRAELMTIAKRSERYYQQAQKKRNERKEEKKKIMAKKSKKSKEKEEKEEEKTTSGSSKKNKKENKNKNKKEKEKKAGGTRQSSWDKSTADGVNGMQSLMLTISGGPWTLGEAQERHDALAKKGKIWHRTTPLVTTDFTWLKLNEVDFDGKGHVRLVGVNEEDEIVFSVPTLPDALKQKAKALKTRKKGDKVIVDGVTMAISRKLAKA